MSVASLADVNECNCSGFSCGNGTCVNTLGSYTCTCHIGYVFNPNKRVCEGVFLDVNA